MIILTILSILFVGSIFLTSYASKKWLVGLEVLAICLSILTGFYLIIHIFSWSFSSYEYKNFIVQKNSFEQSLKDSRENNRELESAAILREISKWNQELARRKLNNTYFLLDNYIDDRIDNIEPIK